MIAYVLFTAVVTARRTRIRRAMNKAEQRSAGLVVDSLANADAVRLFTAEQQELQRFAAARRQYAEKSIAVTESLAFLNFGQQAIFQLGVFGSLYYTCTQIAAGGLPISHVVLVTSLLLQLAAPLNFIGTVYRETMLNLVDLEKLFQLLHQQPPVVNPPNAKPFQLRHGAVSFRHVFFKYPGGAPTNQQQKQEQEEPQSQQQLLEHQPPRHHHDDVAGDGDKQQQQQKQQEEEEEEVEKHKEEEPPTRQLQQERHQERMVVEGMKQDEYYRAEEQQLQQSQTLKGKTDEEKFLSLDGKHQTQQIDSDSTTTTNSIISTSGTSSTSSGHKSNSSSSSNSSVVGEGGGVQKKSSRETEEEEKEEGGRGIGRGGGGSHSLYFTRATKTEDNKTNEERRTMSCGLLLQDFCLDVKAGQKVGIVGASGAGKSTLIKLLYRMYDPTAGAIYIDEQDVKTLDLQSFRKHIGVVPQDMILFNDTIEFNIKYGCPDATFEQVEEAAKRAEIHDAIMRLPDKYKSSVGERGVKLSGGERQRLSIARCLLRNPAIAIFDEATSALDSHTEAKILKAFREMARGRTTLVIAHRLSTIADADLIIYMDKGRVAEAGTHRQLLKLHNGRYKQLWHAQQLQQLNQQQNQHQDMRDRLLQQ